MSLPRSVVPGRSYTLSRRCSERRFFLRPSPETNNNYLYCLGYAAWKAKVALTSTCMMSNHHHTGINDHHGNFPEFLERFHGLLARCHNAYLHHSEAFWSNEATSVVRLVKPEDALDKLVYAFANPTAADLVETIHDWPGAHSLEATLSGGTITATRPKHFFRDDGDMPETITLTFERPIGFEKLSQDEWESLVTNRLSEVESSHRQRRLAEGKHVLGRERVLAQDPFDSPSSSSPRFKLNPKIAAKSKPAMLEAIQEEESFIERHAQSLKDFIAKIPGTLFPHGTYWWRKFAGAICEPNPCSSFDPAPAPA
jgi:putative transposase